ncbi:MAG: hypothetical protein ACLP8S_01800 [Solirubrobacteraceae bacterium]
MSPAQRSSSGARVSLRCTECGAALAVDQRYCLECGQRVSPLPANVAAYIDALERRHRRPAFVTAQDSQAVGSGPARFMPFAMPSPRAAAVAVLGMLAFGSLLGSGATSLATSPLIVLLGGPAALAPPVVSAATPIAPSQTTASTGGGSSTPSSAASDGSGGVTPSGGTPSDTGTTTTTTTTTTTSTSEWPPVKHLFVIMLADQGLATSFSKASHDTYLNRTLADKGELVPSYYGVAQGELANEIALISGQGPTVQTSANCPTFSAIKPAKLGHAHQVLGDGCVYPKRTETLGGQLTAAHDTWKAYIEGLGPATGKASARRVRASRQAQGSHLTQRSLRAHLGSAGKDARRSGRKRAHVVPATSCRRPALGSADQAQAVTSSSDYVTWHNPFVYFQSITSQKSCQTNDVGLTQLATDLKSESATPSFSYIVPGPCDDGSDTPCRPNAPAGTSQSDKFLKTVVPEILASPAYKDDGALIITVDQAPQSGPNADNSSCCNNPTYPNLPATSTTPTTTTTTPTTTTTTPTSTSTTPTSTDTTPTSTDTTPTTTSTTPTTTSTTPTTTSTTPTTTSTTPTTTSTTPTTTSTTPTTTSTTPTTTSTTPTTTTPNNLLPGEAAGGGQVGMLVISSYVTPKSADDADQVNHFSLLALIEDLFSLKPLGYAASASPFSTGQTGLFNAYTG